MLGPREGVPAKRPSDCGVAWADMPQTDDAKSLAKEIRSYGCLPPAATKRSVLSRHVKHERQNESPGELDGRVRVVSCMKDLDTSALHRLSVNGRMFCSR